MHYDRKAFFAAVRPHFRGSKLNSDQVSGLGFILDHAERMADNLKFLAYRLATTFWETDQTMQPIEEIGRGKGKAYGSTGFWGRGYVQLTWETNYRKATARLRELGLIPAGIDFVKTPDLVMKPDYAILILFIGMDEGWFTGKKLATYFPPGQADPLNARRVINGTDRAKEIAAIYRCMLDALLKAERPDEPAPQPALCPTCGRPLAA